MQTLSINAVRYEALFVSALQRSDHPNAGDVRAAITRAVREFGWRGCAERVAQEFGDHPETAIVRMRWAHSTVDGTFTAVRPGSRLVRLSASSVAACAA